MRWGALAVYSAPILAADDEVIVGGSVYSLSEARTLGPSSAEAQAIRLAASKNAGAAEAKRRTTKPQTQKKKAQGKGVEAEIKKGQGPPRGDAGRR